MTVKVLSQILDIIHNSTKHCLSKVSFLFPCSLPLFLGNLLHMKEALEFSKFTDIERFPFI